MNNGNAINPGQLSNMADQNNDNDFSNFDLDNFDLGTFDPATFDLNGFDANGLYDMRYDSTLTGMFNESGGFTNTPFNEPQEPVSMQQPYNTAPFVPTPDQAAPNLAPPLGQLYHPKIGWYYPVQAPEPIFTQQPMSTFTPYSAPPVVENTPTPEPTRPSTGKNKRKYGPSVYVEQQAKRRAIGDDSGPRPVSRESLDYHVPAARKIKPMKGTASKPKKQAPAAGKAPTTTELKKATIQSCECPDAQAVCAAKIPRPSNVFFIFRKEFLAKERASNNGEKRGKDMPCISTEAGKAWAKIKHDAEARRPYDERYNAKLAEHKALFPKYSYKPGVQIRAKFGKPSCTCGGYLMNCAELQRRGGTVPTPEDDHNAAAGEDEDEDEDEAEDETDAYVMPTTRSMSRSNSLAPAPVDQTFDYTFDYNLDLGSGYMPDLGYQNESAESQYDAQLNYTNAAESTYMPPVTRRSTRIGQKTVSYAEETIVKEEDHDGDSQMSDSAPRKKHRSSPIIISSNASPKMSDFVDVSPQGPTSRTRSKSVSFDENQFREASPGDSLFGDCSEDVGENIVVATPMTGISNVSPKNCSGLALPGRATRSQSRGSR